MNKPVRIDVPQQTDLRARFSADEFVRMSESGAFEGMRLELLRGELFRMTPPMSTHAKRQLDVGAQLWVLFRESAGITVFTEIGMDLGDDTILGCDVAVARTSIEERRFLTPNELLLVVEVAETTQTRDMGEKRVAYAAAGVPNYWVVDGDRAVVHVYADPQAGDYAEVHSVRFGAPLAVPGTDASITID